MHFCLGVWNNVRCIFLLKFASFYYVCKKPVFVKIELHLSISQHCMLINGWLNRSWNTVTKNPSPTTYRVAQHSWNNLGIAMSDSETVPEESPPASSQLLQAQLGLVQLPTFGVMAGIFPPGKLVTIGNMVDNWKVWKQIWSNYMVIVTEDETAGVQGHIVFSLYRCWFVKWLPIRQCRW